MFTAIGKLLESRLSTFQCSAMCRLRRDGCITCISIEEQKSFICSRISYRRKGVIFVGDSLRMDIEPASKAGMMTAYASYDDRNINEPYHVKADYILSSIKDILDVKDIGKNVI